MAISTTTMRQKIQRCLQTFDFEKLFIDVLGWDYLRELPIPITIDRHTFTLRPLVEKRGVRVYLCGPDAQGNIPANAVLRKIEHEVIKNAFEHIIIYVDGAQTAQVWQWVRREAGKPAATRLHRYYKGQSGEGLAQKLEALVIAINEEDQLRAADVAGRVAKAFDVERVTRRFYDRFKLEHAAFLQFITGITAQGDREWYASLMLNRLMFIYFIQRKGFLGTTSPQALDGDGNYLANRLQSLRRQQGYAQGNRFQTFYRYFLLKLFHDGLSKRENERSPELQKQLGNVPYLNGGLFDVHTLENAYPDIDIPDEAFEKLFKFFNEFEWHLDIRPLRNDKEINPDVLGYIFEKYINQKQMGAYYTKEDITGYISQNTIIPFIFDATEQKDMVAFRPDGSIWSLLREDPDKYIYDAVKKGCEKPLPPEIAVGVQDVARRDEWNKAAPEEYALPTEIWREVVARRARYEEVKAKLAAGEVTSINDLITYNLDIRTFAGDVITYCEGPDLLLSFYRSIESVTVLDPTCGSGAFLFAALNILEPLYEACLDHMQNLVDERDQLDAGIAAAKRRRYPAIEQFRAILRDVEQHSSRQYFIYKSIIINNLYGVDIMEEATEICKLRLFLKLVSQVEKFKDIEPLPDIDFNIRAGNTLVGFASLAETQKALQGKTVGKGIVRESSAYQNQMIFDDRMNRIEQKAQEIERAFKDFRRIQIEIGQNPEDMATNKQQIRTMLKELGTELDGYLASEYGIDRNNIVQKEVYDEKFRSWQESHQPFHWWIEFYGIMKKGGFDVIIGNPPYVEYSRVKSSYTILNNTLNTLTCGNLFAFVCEKVISLLCEKGRSGVIVLLASFGTVRMLPLQEIYRRFCDLVIASHYEATSHPSVIFVGVEAQLSIILSRKAENPAEGTQYFTTRYIRTYSVERPFLFDRVLYSSLMKNLWAKKMPRLSSSIEQKILDKLQSKSLSVETGESNKEILYFRSMGNFFWKLAFTREPIFQINGVQQQSSTLVATEVLSPKQVMQALIFSSLFYWYWEIYSDVYHLTKTDIADFPINIHLLKKEHLNALVNLAKSVEDELFKTAKFGDYQRKNGRYYFHRFFPHSAKPIIDEIDRVLAKHFGFTDEELDFIINYDIKYRMGRDSGDEGEE